MLLKILLLAAIVALMLYAARKSDRWDGRTICLFICYLGLVAWFTLLGRVPLSTPRVLNLIPGGSVRTMYLSPWNDRGGYEFAEILGNLALFFPFGFCLRHGGKWRYSLLLLAALLLSGGIETLQYGMNIGTFEVDDILHNVWGAALGANYAGIRKHLRGGRTVRSLPTGDTLAMWPLLVLVIYALAMFIRFIIKKGWLY